MHFYIIQLPCMYCLICMALVIDTFRQQKCVHGAFRKGEVIKEEIRRALSATTSGIFPVYTSYPGYNLYINCQCARRSVRLCKYVYTTAASTGKLTCESGSRLCTSGPPHFLRGRGNTAVRGQILWKPYFCIVGPFENGLGGRISVNTPLFSVTEPVS